MKTLIMILVSLGVGVGSTLLVQTVIVHAPARGRGRPVPNSTTVVEQAMIEKALEPLPVDDYVPQGQLHAMPSMSGRED